MVSRHASKGSNGSLLTLADLTRRATLPLNLGRRVRPAHHHNPQERVMRNMAVLTLVLILTTGARAQQPVTPGPEHKALKEREGTWDTTLKAGGMEFKGTVTFKMELGGLWLVGSMETDLGGQKFYGKSMDTYDAEKKKYVEYWFDSMSTTPMTMEGTFDPAKKTLTMLGQGPGTDGKPTTWRSVSHFPDSNTVHMSMYVGDAKEPMFTVTYTRKK
jgi:hypothetical protein